MTEAKMTLKQEVLRVAMDAVDGKQRSLYGHPSDNFANISTAWMAYFKMQGWKLTDAGGNAVELLPRHIAKMMRDVKEARLVHTPGHVDGLADLIGYTLCEADIFDKEHIEDVAKKLAAEVASAGQAQIDAEKAEMLGRLRGMKSAPNDTEPRAAADAMQDAEVEALRRAKERAEEEASARQLAAKLAPNIPYPDASTGPAARKLMGPPLFRA